MKALLSLRLREDIYKGRGIEMPKAQPKVSEAAAVAVPAAATA
jgi:hypothetical protein